MEHAYLLNEKNLPKGHLPFQQGAALKKKTVCRFHNNFAYSRCKWSVLGVQDHQYLIIFGPGNPSEKADPQAK